MVTVASSFTAKVASAARIYLRALREVRAFWPHLGIVLLLSLAATPLALLNPLPVKLIIDTVLGHQPARWPFSAAGSPDRLFALAIGLAVALAVLGLLLNLFEWLFREWVAERMVLRFRMRLFERALLITPASQDAAATQDVAFRIACDAPALQWTAIYGVIPVVTSLAALAGTIWVTARLSLLLAELALATAIPAMVLIYMSQKQMRGLWHSVRELESSVQSVVQEVLGAVRLVLVFGQEEREQMRFAGACGSAVGAKLKTISRQGLLSAAMSLSTGLGSIAILWVGVREVQAGQLSVGDLLMIIAYVAQIYGPLQQLGLHISGQQQAIAGAERAFELLDRPPAVAERPVTQPVERSHGAVTLRGVRFSYAAGAPILDGVTVNVPPGSLVGIVGRSGAGKSTLIGLLLRLFDPQAGRIEIDGMDVRDMRVADVRRQFAVVPQDPVLFSMTIAENIAYGRPNASMKEIVAAATAAHAHDFIMSLPEGYDTQAGERGTRLSGGQRQRIAVARAFLKDAPILILDEPTSAVDVETEAAVLAGMERLMKGRTTFMVTHRVATLRKADIVLRLADGLIEQVTAGHAADPAGTDTACPTCKVYPFAARKTAAGPDVAALPPVA